jgi:hypothetical protein
VPGHAQATGVAPAFAIESFSEVDGDVRQSAGAASTVVSVVPDSARRYC